MRRIVPLLAALAAHVLDVAEVSAAPDPGPDVDLLTAATTVVAVSSTVANQALAPEHLVDGDLETAWNSRTGELRGAWIAARVPVEAHVTAIRMTIGFTKIDSKLGDLFTKNPRIGKVRVLRDGLLVVEQALDPDVRTLQDIPIDGPGGDYKIEIAAFVPGTRASWQEICVSEFQIRGRLGGSTGATPTRPTRPTVRVGSLDPPRALNATECVAALLPHARRHDIRSSEAMPWPGGITLCRVEHTTKFVEDQAPMRITQGETETIVAPVVSRARTVVGRPIKISISESEGPDAGSGGTVHLTAVPWTTGEPLLRIGEHRSSGGPTRGHSVTTSTLYRVTAGGLTQVLESFQSTRDDSEWEDTSSTCELAPFTVSAKLPRLVVDCVNEERGAAPRHVRSHYVWTGAAYDLDP